MKRETFRRVLALLAVVAAAGMIYFFSAQTASSSSAISGSLTEELLRLFVRGYDALSAQAQRAYRARLELIVRKLAHFSEYALLALLAAHCLHLWFPKARVKTCALLAWALSTLYACTDEWHQRFVSGRGPALLDVGIDSAGALAGVLIAALLMVIVGRRKKKQ